METASDEPDIAIGLTVAELLELQLYLSWSSDMLEDHEALRGGLPPIVDEIITMDHTALVAADVE